MTSTNPPENKGNRTSPQSRSSKKPRSEASRQAKVAKKSVNQKPLEDWLSTQNFPVNVTVKVNGPSSEAAILVVDFGSPIGGAIRLNPEQSDELTNRMKQLAGDFYAGDTSIRVSYDQSHGIYWASLS